MDNARQEARDPNTPQETLLRLVRSADGEVQSLVAQNPNTPIEALLQLAKRLPKEVSQNPSLSLALLETPHLIQALDQQTAFAFALCEEAPEWLLELLFSHPKREIVRLISYRKNLSEALLWKLAQKAEHLDKIIANPRCTKELWTKFATSRGLCDRLFVARAKNLPDDIRELLERDPEPQIQQALRLRDEPPRQAPLPRLRHAGATDVGRERNHNEDAFGVYHGETLSLFVVADGMGGQSTGMVAAEAARELLQEKAKRADLNAVNAQEFLHQAFIDSYQAFGRAAQRTSCTHLYEGEHLLAIHIGAAVVALLLQGNTATIAHAGDSRAYLLRGQKLARLTEDHSLLNDAIKQGYLSTPEDIESFPHKNIITRALGMGVSSSTPEITRLEVQPRDLLLLCSDGLTSMVSEEMIRHELQTEKTPEEKSARLIALANEAGGKDNITVLVIELE